MSAPSQQIVLIVDDDESLLRTLARMLQRLGVKVQRATNGREALELALQQQFDIIITDMRMPRMSGFELITSLTEKLETVPRIIVLSGYHDVAEAELRAAGVSTILSKPVSFDELRKHVLSD